MRPAFDQVLAAATNVRWGRERSHAPAMNFLAATTVFRARFTVQTQMDDPAGPEQRNQLAQSRDGIGQMVQHADRNDDVERPVDRSQVHDVCLRVFDVRQADLAGLPFRIAKTRQAQVDRKHARRRKLLRRCDRFLARAASRNQDVDIATLGERSERGSGETLTQVIIDLQRLARRRQFHPPRVWVFLVLLPNRARHAVFNAR